MKITAAFAILATAVIAAPQPGTSEREPITHRWFATGAFPGTAHAKKAADYFEKFHDKLTAMQPQIARIRPSQAARYDLNGHALHLTVPAAYADDGTWGVYLHLSPGDDARVPTAWEPVLAKYKLIAASPHRAGNNHGEWFRAVQALDTLATLRRTHKLAPARNVIGGFSGGGYMALWTFTIAPDVFAGVISHGKDFPRVKMELPGNRAYAAAMPFLDERDWRNVATKKKPWIFIIGDGDPNHALFEKQRPDWATIGQRTELITMPGKGHAPAGAEELSQSLRFIFGTK